MPALPPTRMMAQCLTNLCWVSLLCVSLFAAAFSAQAQAQPPLITMAVAQAPIHLDPRYASDAASARVQRLLYQALVDFDTHQRVIPQLATWQASTPQDWLFTLQQRPLFHHGRRLSAEDVVATYRSLANIASPLAGEFANIAQVTALNDQQIRFQLKQPDPDFVSKLILGILPADLIQAGHDFDRQPIGSGPLKLLSQSHRWLLQRLRDGQQIQLLEVKDPTVRVLKLLHGEVDILQGDLPPELVRKLQHQAGIQVQASQGANYSYIGLNMHHAVLRQPLVRRALAHAIDTQAIVQYALVPGSRPATAILPPEHWAGNSSLQPYRYQPQLAKQLLQQAGIPLPLVLHYKTSTDAQRLRLATILQAQMQAAGIQLVIDSHDWGTFFGDIQQGRFELYGLTWVGIKTPDIYAKAFSRDAIPPNGFNRGAYRDAQLDALLAQGAWPQVTQRIHQQLPYLPLWYEGQVVAHSSAVHGYRANREGNWDDLARVSKHSAVSMQ